MPSFDCPKCKKILKTRTPVAPGKKVKCPGCAHVFAAPGDSKTGIQAKGPPAPPRKSVPVDDDDEPKRRRPDPDDDDEAPRRTSRKAKARDDDDDDEEDEDEEEDERPRRKKKKAKSNNQMMLILGGAGGALLLLIVLAFIFLRGGGGGDAKVAGGKGKGGAGGLDPLAFVPDNADFVAGLNLGVLRTRPDVMQQIEQALRQQPNFSPTALELIKNADRGIVAGGAGGNVVAAFSSVAPMDPDKVRQTFNAGQEEKVQGKSVFRINKPGAASRDLLALPDDKTVVIGTMSDADFAKVLEARGKLPPALDAQVTIVGNKQAWAVVNLESALKDKAGDLKFLEAMPNGADAVAALRSARTATFSGDSTVDAQIAIEIQCANDGDATRLDSFLKNTWDKQGKPMLQFIQFGAAKQPNGKAIGMLLTEVSQNLKFDRQGSVASASLTISEKTMKEIEKLQPQGLGAAQPQKVIRPKNK